MIIPVYKPLGASSHQLAAQIGEKLGEKATHTGTLDPMAEGVLVVLTGENRFQKSELANTEKEYHFSILFDIATDSHDLLGLPTEVAKETLDPTQLKERLTQSLAYMVGTTNQEQPVFSAGREDGQSFFDLGKQQQTPQKIKENTITIHDMACTQVRSISKKEVLTYQKKAIKHVVGDFRQESILQAWKKQSKELPETLYVADCVATVSKRTYIRGIVRDVAEKLEIPATTFSIIRTKNGPYRLEDCQSV